MDQKVGPDKAGGAGGDGAMEEALPLADVIEDKVKLHVSDVVDGGDEAMMAGAELAKEGRVEASSELEGIGMDEGDKVLEVVAKGGEVEETTTRMGDMERTS